MKRCSGSWRMVHPVDYVTVFDAVDPKLRGPLEIGSTLSIVEDYTPSAANVHYYADIVQEKARRRQIVQATTRISQQANGGEPLEVLSQEMAEEASSILRAPKEPSPADLGLVLAADLEDLASEEHEYVVHGLLPKGWLSLVLADPKCGKSMVVRNLVSSIMSGGSWLGRQVEHKGHVLYLAWEEDPSDVSGSTFNKWASTSRMPRWCCRSGVEIVSRHNGRNGSGKQLSRSSQRWW